jgi:polyhydroxybutyrate depolymerase
MRPSSVAVAFITTSVLLSGAACGACGGSAATSMSATNGLDASVGTGAGDAAIGSTLSPTDDAGQDGPVIDPGGTCRREGVVPGYAAQSLTSSGQHRTYGLFVPDAYDSKTALPIVFVFHGDGGTGAGMRGINLEAKAAGKAVFVYPDGLNQTWDLDTPPGQNKDYVFFDDLVADVASKLCVDTKRVFLFGLSNGAFFANQLGCFRGDKIRGFVSHSGGGPYTNNPSDFGADGIFSACNTTPPAALIIHGDADTVVPFEAGQKSARYWRIKNGCRESTNPYSQNPCVSYAGCNMGHPVVWCPISGLDHALWSSATDVAWSFFSSL